MKVDGIGVHHGVVEAAVWAIVRGIAASGSVMTVCPGTPQRSSWSEMN
jgi:hypothetical protein